MMSTFPGIIVPMESNLTAKKVYVQVADNHSAYIFYSYFLQN